VPHLRRRKPVKNPLYRDPGRECLFPSSAFRRGLG
jgi:hypothetical protein